MSVCGFDKHVPVAGGVMCPHMTLENHSTAREGGWIYRGVRCPHLTLETSLYRHVRTRGSTLVANYSLSTASSISSPVKPYTSSVTFCPSTLINA